MVVSRAFTRNYGKYLLSYDKLFKDIYTKPKKLIKYNESKEQKIICDHVSDKLGDNIKYFYKYIYPKR